MINFKKKYHYSKEDIEAAHELVFVRLERLRSEEERFTEKRKVEMSDGSFIRGEEAEGAWNAFNDNDWTYLNGAVMCAKELGKELKEM